MDVGALVGVLALPRMGGTPPLAPGLINPKSGFTAPALAGVLWWGLASALLWWGCSGSGCSGGALVGVSDGGQP